MKKILLFSLIASLSFSGISQTDTTTVNTKLSYLERSRNQNTAGWVLLLAGTGITLAGILRLTNKNVDLNDLGPGATTMLIGSGILGLGCGLFIASFRNKKKANRLNGFLRMEKATGIKQGSLVQQTYPAISLRLRL